MKNIKERIVEELGIDASNVKSYEGDIEMISKVIGGNNVLAKGDEPYNKDLNYTVLQTIQGEIDTYDIVRLN